MSPRLTRALAHVDFGLAPGASGLDDGLDRGEQIRHIALEAGHGAYDPVRVGLVLGNAIAAAVFGSRGEFREQRHLPKAGR